MVREVDGFKTLEGEVLLLDFKDDRVSSDAKEIHRSNGGDAYQMAKFYFSKTYYVIRNVLRI